MTATTTQRAALYRLFDQGGALLYVGVAANPRTRWSTHSKEKAWWCEVASKTVEWHGDRPTAEAAEVAAIVTEAPRYNVEHSTTRQRGDARSEYQSPYDKPRQIRIATQMWRDFGAATKAEGTTRGRVIAQFVAWYLHRPGAKALRRPDVSAWRPAVDATEEN
ncbi:MAG: hypothetical protein JWO98_3691 [Frankiales bacterium]|nr:hypothetical protein [Frankiales bacterium]